MWKDPIVEEVRKAGRKVERQAGRDLGKFFRLLRALHATEYETRHSRPETGGKVRAVAEERSFYGKV